MAPPWLPRPLESEVANLYLSELPSASLGSDCCGEGIFEGDVPAPETQVAVARPWALPRDGPFASVSPLGQGTRLQPEEGSLGGWH